MEQHARTWEESPNIMKRRRKQGVNQQFMGAFDTTLFITRYGINPHISILWLFMDQVQPFGILKKGSDLRPSGFTRLATSARLAGDVIQVWVNSSPSNRCISHFKAQLAQLSFLQHLKCTYWIKGILCGYEIRSGRHPSGSQRPGPLTSLGMPAWPYRVTTKYSYYINMYIYIFIWRSW